MAGRIYSQLLKDLPEPATVTETDYELVDRFKDGDRNAGHLLFIRHYKMILKVILDITDGRWYDDDFLHAGAVGLYEAAVRFDKELGYTFLTYATHYIRKYVRIEVANDALPTGGIAIGRDFKEKMYRYIGLKMVGHTPEEISEMMKLSPREALKLYNAVTETSRPVSLNNILDSEEEAGEDYTLDGMPTVSSAEEEYITEDVIDSINSMINSMDSIDRDILNYTLGANGSEVLEKKALASKLGMSIGEYNRARRTAYRRLKQAIIAGGRFD